jgi:hypothetical protein
VGENGEGEVSIPEARERDRSEVGEGGKSAIAAETQFSNSSWVMLDREEESMVSINWIAPDKEDR